MKGAEPFSIECLPRHHVAKKLHAIQSQGLRNTGAKDYFDLMNLMGCLDPEGVA
jgi:hypothetical protein